MPGLKAVVYVTGPDGTVRLGPGDEIPDWALAEITNPDCWDGEPPSVEVDEPEVDDTQDGEPAEAPKRATRKR